MGDLENDRGGLASRQRRDEPRLPGKAIRARAGAQAPAPIPLASANRAPLQAAALAGDLSTAEDLVSETLVQALKSLPRYDRTCRLSTWP